jgi:hypothetical protein
MPKKMKKKKITKISQAERQIKQIDYLISVAIGMGLKKEISFDNLCHDIERLHAARIGLCLSKLLDNRLEVGRYT